MRILVVGCRGNMGRRYSELLMRLGHQVIGIDQGDVIPHSISLDRIIIATNTGSHIQWCLWAQTQKLPYLCEKPITTSEINLLPFLTGSCVCNWAFVFERPLIPGRHRVEYNFHHTGPHGPLWDCFQLYHLDPNASIRTDSEIFQAYIDDTPVTSDAIAMSYLRMLKYWTMDSAYIWPIVNTIQTHQRIYERVHRDTGKVDVNETAR